jgi:CBS domain-containing protein/sporulation protein YlmC with PRC-barrel domain
MVRAQVGAHATKEAAMAAPNPKMPIVGVPKGESYELFFFSQIVKRPVCVGTIRKRLGRLSDVVFRLQEPYPEAVGLFLEFGWGKPTQFIPWDKVVKIDDDAIFAQAPEGDAYPPFVDQKGWILADKHLMGRTVLDMDGRRTDVVNDVHLLYTRGKLMVVHVDFSFNGFLRKWGLGWIRGIKDHLISWKYIQPLSVEDAVTTDIVSLSVARKQIKNLPGEDLADALEELSGPEQEALFSALDSEKAAETLVEAEPRVQRQIVANLRKERARNIMTELSVPQLADLFSVLPHDDVTELMPLVPEDRAGRVRAILNDREVNAATLMSPTRYIAVSKDATVGEILALLRAKSPDPEDISYLYAVKSPENMLIGVVDLRELILAPDTRRIEDIMVADAVSADPEDTREDLEELFKKYHFRMIPVVDAHDRLLGVVHYNDIL